MLDLQKIVDRWSVDKGSDVMLPWLGSTTCGEVATVIADALRQTAELRAERDALAALAYWFRKWPEFKPSPEFASQLQVDLSRATPFIPSDRLASKGE